MDDPTEIIDGEHLLGFEFFHISVEVQFFTFVVVSDRSGEAIYHRRTKIPSNHRREKGLVEHADGNTLSGLRGNTHTFWVTWQHTF